MNLFQDLKSCVVITRENGKMLLPGCARQRDAASALILPNPTSANKLIDRIQHDVEDLFGSLGFEMIEDPFTLMRRAAQEGIGSFDSTEAGMLDHPLVFCTRASEIGDNLPSLLAEYADNENLKVLTRSGQRTMRSIDVIPWRRFDITDPLLGIWSTNNEPFRNWDSGNQLIGMIVDGCIPALRRCPITGHWSSLEGTIPIFASEDDYNHACRENQLFKELTLFGPFDFINYPVLHRIQAGPREIHLISIKSLPEFLSDLSTQIPILACGQFSINPFCHRENGGYGWTANFIKDQQTINPHSTQDTTTIKVQTGSDITRRCGQKSSFNTVSGEWSIDLKNIVSLVHQTNSWANRATLHWSGGTSISLGNLSYSLVHIDQWHDFSDEEKKDALKCLFEEDCENVIYDEDLGETSLKAQAHLFTAGLWDTYTGEEFVLRVASPYALISFLIKHLQEFDQRIRIQGGRPCGSPATGSAGTGNIEQEQLLTKQAQAALLGVAESIALSGYIPKKGQRICYIVNRLFETLHMDFAGYTQDLIIQCELDDDLELLSESLDLELDAVKQLKNDIDLHPPSEGLVILKNISRQRLLELSSPKAIYFAANGLFDMSLKGESPHLDYATVSIEFVKALEVELGSIFRLWISSISLKSLKFGSSRQEADVQNYMKNSASEEGIPMKSRMFSIGTMGYLLRDIDNAISKRDKVNEPDSLISCMASKVETIEDIQPLLHKSFYKKFLNKVSHSYRNGGAHDQKISLSTCIQCRDDILGTSSRTGWLTIVSQALASLNQSLFK